VWRQVVPALAASHRVHVFDLLGFGQSERRVDQQLSVALHGRVLAELIEAWGVEDPVLVGHDIGGATVLRAHLLEGVPVARLALIDAVVLRPWITQRTRQMQRERDRYTLPDAELEASIRRHLGTATSRPLRPEVYDDLFGQWDGELGQALYLRNLAGFDERDTAAFEPLLPAIAAPTLILWGQEDAWLPVAVSERIAAEIPGARRVVLRDAGHFCMEDRPQEVADALVSFCGER